VVVECVYSISEQGCSRLPEITNMVYRYIMVYHIIVNFPRSWLIRISITNQPSCHGAGRNFVVHGPGGAEKRALVDQFQDGQPRDADVK